MPVTTDGFPDRPSLFDEEGFWSAPFAAELGLDGCGDDELVPFGEKLEAKIETVRTPESRKR